ncbi:MAG: V-type ATP synthase subunit F [Candidatus Hodarchaeota archaeon]
MPEQKIFVIGEEETVLMMGLLGIEGLILDKPGEFLKEFNILIQDPSIGMLIVAMELQNEDTKYLLDYKLNRKKPFVFYLPDVFKPKLGEQVAFLEEIIKSIGKIIK